MAAAALFGLLVLAGALPALSQGADGAFSAAQADRGSRFYADKCASCHGAEFTGSTGTPALKGPEFAFGWEGKPVSALYDYIRTMMPSGMIGVLNDQEYADVTARILAANGLPAGKSELAKDSSGMNTTIHIPVSGT